MKMPDVVFFFSQSTYIFGLPHSSGNIVRVLNLNKTKFHWKLYLQAIYVCAQKS